MPIISDDYALCVQGWDFPWECHHSCGGADYGWVGLHVVVNTFHNLECAGLRDMCFFFEISYPLRLLTRSWFGKVIFFEILCNIPNEYYENLIIKSKIK